MQPVLAPQGDALDRVRLIRRALAIGSSLDELRRVLHVRDRGGAPCRKVSDLAAGKLANSIAASLIGRIEFSARLFDNSTSG